MSPKKTPPIHGIAMLVNVNVGMWWARKFDRDVSDKVNLEMAKNKEAGRYNKRLFGGSVKSHGELVTAGQKVRKTHYAQTLPWDEEGWRLLSSANYLAYTEAINERINEYDACRDVFLGEYTTLCRQAAEKLGKMYRREDYPSLNQIRHKFYVKVKYSPIPSGTALNMLGLSKQELNKMSKTVEDRVNQAVKEAMNEAWQRLGDSVGKLREYLGDGKRLRQSMITQLSEVAEILGRLNLTSDTKLETARTQVLKDLANLDAETLRENEDVRSVAAQKAADIMKQMAGMYTPAGG